MTKQEIISKWEKEIEYLKKKQADLPKQSSITWNCYAINIRSISAMLDDCKKLNEESGSEVNVCPECNSKVMIQHVCTNRDCIGYVP